MGETTYWFGRFAVEPALGTREVELLDRLSEGADVRGAATLGRCGWVASADRASIVWDRSEKFNDGADWLRILLSGDLTGFRSNGTVFGVCCPESVLIEAVKITVEDGAVVERIYDIPMVDDEAYDDEASIYDFFYAISGLDGTDPDYVEASQALDEFLSAVPLSSLGELETFMTELLELLDRPEPLASTFDKHCS